MAGNVCVQDAADSQDPSRLLACPFWKLNPETYRECGRRKLRKLSRVKQHLNLYHRQPVFCSCCMSTFPSDAARLEHERARRCAKRDFVEPPGLSREQLAALHRRPAKNLSTQEQWFTVWDIVFPLAERPMSAYIDIDVSEDLTSFREFVMTNAPGRATDEMERENIWNMEPSRRRACMKRMFQEVLDDSYEEWIANFRASQAGARQAALSKPPRQQVHPPSPVISSLPSSCYSSSHPSTSTTPSFGPVTPNQYRNAAGPDEVPSFPDLSSQSQQCHYPQGQGLESNPAHSNLPVTPKSILFSQARRTKPNHNFLSSTTLHSSSTELGNIPEIDPTMVGYSISGNAMDGTNMFFTVGDDTCMESLVQQNSYNLDVGTEDFLL